jgi:predicted N-acetyltransferase YhbS
MRIADSDADRLAVIEVAHAATRPEAPLAWFQALRMASALRAQATWWLLEEDGRAVSSLLCYPLRFALDGRVVQGHGLGAVATRPDARRRGLARALCEHAVEAAEAEGRPIGLLFSAIPPAYYGRIGYRALPAWAHVADRLDDLAGSGPRATLVAIDPRRHVERLASHYERHHGGALHLHRDAAGYARTVAVHAGDGYLGVGDPLRAYARIALDAESMEVVELVGGEAEFPAVLRELARIASALGKKRLEGWFPPVPEVAPWFRDEGRATTLPMVRGVADVGHAQFWPSEYF